MSKIEQQVLERLYLEENKTDVEIASILKVTKGAVYLRRKKWGIKAIPRAERNICIPTAEQLSVLYGCLLGDGSVSNGIKRSDGRVYSCHSSFEVKHCAAQKDYLFWKHEILSNLCCSAPRQTNNGQWRLRTFHHEFFSGLRRLFYPNGRKIVPAKMLDSITPFGLAVWFMDDGRNYKESTYLELCTCSFTQQDLDVLSSWLMERYKITTRTVINDG